MVAPFAAIETATVANTVAALANVTATIGAVTGVEGIFDKDYSDAFGITDGTRPVLLISATAAPAAAVGTSVTINAVTYTIAEIQPDGTGMTRLFLKT